MTSCVSQEFVSNLKPYTFKAVCDTPSSGPTSAHHGTDEWKRRMAHKAVTPLRFGIEFRGCYEPSFLPV